jgi:hypothetical protein
VTDQPLHDEYYPIHIIGVPPATSCGREGIMRRTKSKKLELRRQRVARMDRPDPIQALREIKQEQLQEIAGGCAEMITCPDCCC